MSVPPELASTIPLIDKFQDNLTKDDARYENSVFFSVRKIIDSSKFLPGKVILGINKHGIHLFCSIPNECLFSAGIRDIKKFGRNTSAIYFNMIVAGALHTFVFETEQGEKICAAVQTHIDDIVDICATADGSVNRDEDPRESVIQVLHKIQDEVKVRSLELHAAKASKKLLVNENRLLEQRISLLKQKQVDEMRTLEKNFEQEQKALSLQVSELEKKLKEATMNFEQERKALSLQVSELEKKLKEATKCSSVAESSVVKSKPRQEAKRSKQDLGALNIPGEARLSKTRKM